MNAGCPEPARCDILAVCQAKCPRYSLQRLQQLRTPPAPTPAPREPWLHAAGESS